jgi:hypothetical protein
MERVPESLSPLPESISPRRPPAAIRVLAVLAGLTGLLVVGVFTLGLALVGALGVWVAAFVQRRRGQPSTRGTSWLGAAGLTSLAVAGLMAFGFSRLPPGFYEQTQRTAIEQQRHPSEFSRRIGRIIPGAVPDSATQARAEAVTRSKPVLWWGMAMGFLLGCTFLGALIGSAAWAPTVLLLYGATGRWPARRAPASPPAEPE